MKIGDLWVKLGLKKDEFSKGMKQADGEVKGFAGSMKSMSAVGAAAWAAVSAAVVKFAKDAIAMTQRWGDAWNQTMAGIKGAYSSFVRQISSGDGWNNLFANMREAYRVSKEVAAALDEIFERKTSFSYQEADTERQIAQLQLIARDSSKSEAERIAANKRIIELTNQLGDAKKAIYTDEAANQRRIFQLQTGLNDEQTDFLVKEYNQNREVINQAREYLRLKQQLSSVGGQGFFTQSVGPLPAPVASGQRVSPELEKLERETPQAIKNIAELTKMYDRGNDALVKGMADAEVAVIRIDTETAHAQTRATALLGTLQKAGRATAEAATDWGKIFNEIDKDLAVKLRQMPSLDFDVPEVEIDDDFFQFNLDQLMDGLQRAQEFAEELRATIAGGVSDAIQELADQFAGLEDINPGRVVQALLTPLADMAIKEGEIVMAMGVGIKAVKEGLESLDWKVQLVAGAALIAIGAAAKAGLGALARSGGASTATTSYGSAGASSVGAQTQTIQTEMTVYVTGRLSGSDILLSGQKTQSNWNR